MLEVTKDDIREGVRGSFQTCPLRRAANRLYGRSKVSMNSSGFWIFGMYYKLTWKMIRFIRDFDAGKPVKPTKFRLLKGEQL